MVFFLKRVNKRIDQLDQNLKDSFEHVRKDNENLYAWIRYLNEQSENQAQELLRTAQKIDSHESRIAMQNRVIHDLKLELTQVPKSREEVKKMVDEVCSFEPILDRIRRVESRVENLEFKRKEAPKPAPKVIPAEPRQSALKERVLRRIARNSKDYIKSVITGIIRKYGKISALQLREMIVDEQGLCSKSSFYRILEELEQENVMNLVSRGKEKLYVSTQK
ncbi:hypothetical protein GF358_02460 [Candidatus Woesearchaeota archaeon]|nr:hypothetical protein [Candidatus Woesearchaeota archaeon]